ncbi:relaxase/mobilization nuclease domain-containing protein [Daejeonella sp.]|uniref:relaxase/mobilization nuclease domain-containing protein n=1 Tax=Daejeonella sp. TaxID=2805397 RepID=UPI0030C58ADA
MVSKIISGKSIIGALNYNERKVAQGKADLIAENGYAKDISKMNFYDKLLRLTDLAERNTRVVTNTVHISLNFDPSERIGTDRLSEIAKDYMERIGFGDQPFLVYEHTDAGHPHIHIVATNIKPSGERISLHNLGRTKSEEARQAIEREYGLVQAKNKSRILPAERDQVRKAEYGKIDTKRAITNIVNEVVRNYRFTSIPEMNAVLNQYNVTADQGSKESRMFQKNGLMYWIINDSGKKLGLPIKASSIYCKPTLKTLQDRFTVNATLRKPMRERLKVAIDRAIQRNPTKDEFTWRLKREGIHVVFRVNDQQRLYGITFVDQRNRCVFNGSDLGKDYSASALSSKFSLDRSAPQQISNPTTERKGSEPEIRNDAPQHSNLLPDLLNPEHTGEGSNTLFRRKKKRYKRKLL